MERYRISADSAVYYMTSTVVEWLPLFVREEPCRINRKSDDTIIAEFTYSYDPTYWGKNGTRTRVIENILKPDGNRISAQVDYEYDDLYRLVHEHRIAYNGGDPGVAYEYNFAYDDAGNRTSWQTVGGSTVSYTYDAADDHLDEILAPPYYGNRLKWQMDCVNRVAKKHGHDTNIVHCLTKCAKIPIEWLGGTTPGKM
jgi:hypothetical protein